MRGRGGYIGFNRVPAAAALNSAASGVWTLQEAESLKRAGTWPVSFENPVSITGLQLWLDAADSATLFDATSGGSLVAADGGVARWEDKSGNARHATQSTSANRPARKTAIQGGKDVLRFDGSNDSLSIPSSTGTFAFLHLSNATIFLVFKVNGANPNNVQAVLDNSNGTADKGFTCAYDDRSTRPVNDRVYFYGGQSVPSIYAYGCETENDKFPPGAFKAITGRIQAANATASQRCRIYVNGTIDPTVNTFSGTLTGNAAGNLHVGCQVAADTSATSNFLNGDIAEIVIYNSALSDTDRGLVESYLMAKWGLT